MPFVSHRVAMCLLEDTQTSLSRFPKSRSDPEQNGGTKQQTGHPDQLESKLQLPPRNQRCHRQDDELQAKTELLLEMHFLAFNEERP
jgi:hypothetical protein